MPISINPESLSILDIIDESAISCSGLIKKKKIIIENKLKKEDICYCDRNTLKNHFS